MRYLVILALVAASSCGSVKTFSDATDNVNERYALGKQLRDRCDATGDVDHCLAWTEYKREAEADNPMLDYDKGLARWEANGPY